MKKLLSVLVLALIAIQFVNAKEIVTQDEKKLPTEARNFITEHFPQIKISYIKIDDEFLQAKTYEAVLTNGVEIDFDSKGVWKEVDTKREQVPAAIIPTSIRNYVSTNFSSNIITKIERERNGFEVELDNDLTLEFDNNGTLKRIDD